MGSVGIVGSDRGSVSVSDIAGRGEAILATAGSASEVSTQQKRQWGARAQLAIWPAIVDA